MNRRVFLLQSVAASAALGTGLLRAQPVTPSETPAASPPPAGTEPKRTPALELTKVREFVGAGHNNLARIKELLATEPQLALASYDWGGGDFETALGAASHVGRREIALHLLEAGARIDAFCAAMLGETALVNSLVRFSPATASTRGPHGYTLLYHAGYSGNIPLGEAIVAHLRERGPHCNQALHTAVLRGHTEFVTWLLKNGADNVSTRNFAGKTPLDLAVEKGHTEITQLLRGAGG